MIKNNNLKLIKKLRDQTGAGMVDCHQALEKAVGNFDKALSFLSKRGEEVVQKKSQRETKEGWIGSYIHSDGKIGALVVLLCETDFVARTKEFRNLARELAMQVTAMEAETPDDLLRQDYIRDPSIKVADVIKKIIVKTGENILVQKIIRLSL